MEDPIGHLVEKFNAKLQESQSMQNELQGIKRTLDIVLQEDKTRLFLSKEGLAYTEDNGKKPDISIITTRETLSDILERRIDPMKAYLDGDVKVKASILDMLKAKSILSS